MEATESAVHPSYVMVPRSAIEELLASTAKIQPPIAPASFNPDTFLDEFELACRIDYRLRPRTIVEHLRHVGRLCDFLKKHPLQATRHDLRQFLRSNPAVNAIKALRVLYGKFLGSDLASCFKVPQSSPRVVVVPSRGQLRHTYVNLESLELRAAFLLLATSGLRRHELVELTWSQIDMEKRMIVPPSRQSNRTKFQWVTFFNQEARDALVSLRGSNPRLDEPIFHLHPDTMYRKFRDASDGRVTPQVLREWFSNELGRLRVPDRYVDAFCGHIPKKVLARHYTDYSPENLKVIYEEAGLRVLKGDENYG